VPPREDPAERAGYLRFFYRGWRPTLVGRLWSRAYAWVSGLGLLPSLLVTLQTSDRRSGRTVSTILVVAEHQGQRYLVSMLGEHSQWLCGPCREKSRRENRPSRLRHLRDDWWWRVVGQEHRSSYYPNI